MDFHEAIVAFPPPSLGKTKQVPNVKLGGGGGLEGLCVCGRGDAWKSLDRENK